jgi:hypothetical protein
LTVLELVLEYITSEIAENLGETKRNGVNTLWDLSISSLASIYYSIIARPRYEEAPPASKRQETGVDVLISGSPACANEQAIVPQ